MDAAVHTCLVTRLGPQRYQPSCSCGWIGTNRKGNDPWTKEGALARVMEHQRSQNAPLVLPEYTDQDPESSRRSEP